jgi:hypothetical protein
VPVGSGAAKTGAKTVAAAGAAKSAQSKPAQQKAAVPVPKPAVKTVKSGDK